VIDVSPLEFCLREDLNKTAPRVMVVLDPVKLVITNYPEDKEESLDAENNQEDDAAGFRKLPFLVNCREDFLEVANSEIRLSIGNEVRLKNAYIIKGESVVKDSEGTITEIHVSYDEDSRSGSGVKLSTKSSWNSCIGFIKHAIEAEVRCNDRLFIDEAPDSHKEKNFRIYEY
jgi:glutaminyl-tRNA synthetase